MGETEPIDHEHNIPTDTEEEHNPELGTDVYEVALAFELAGAPLSGTLRAMLHNEEQHQGGRRGCGYTQASREVASFVRNGRSDSDIQMFDYSFQEKAENARLSEWDEQILTAKQAGHSIYEVEMPPLNLPSRLDMDRIDQITDEVKLEESKLLARMILDIIKPYQPSENDTVLPSRKEQLKIGTCTTAEVYFLDFIQRRDNYPGYFNAITDSNGEIVMLEKIGMGEDHSCLTVKETVINGVRLPAGSLIGVSYNHGIDSAQSPTPYGKIRNYFSLELCSNFEFLRVSPLAITPENRARAFTTHLGEAQNNPSLEGLETATLDDFRTRISETFS